ncbi:MAG TPA: ATP-grasp domain-containing protein [Caulobacteraceae bacterium]|jgi:predicted ATP-grasp superfamily ATP-dependent carboligase|nr:ATP-grasp domain-containing protein [Caulobacteraceae bacterium]
MAERVLITGARAPAALELARSFAAAGLEVHMADCSRARMARRSRIPAGVHRYASPRREREQFAQDIRALVQTLNPVLIVPACEEVFHLAALVVEDLLDERLFAPCLGVLKRLHSKVEFIEACRGLGLNVPNTWRLSDDDDLRRIGDRSRDLVFKPEFSRFGVCALVGAAPYRLAGVKPTEERPWVMQQRIRGEDASFYAVARDGRLSAFCAYRSSWRTAGGVAYAFAPAEVALAQDLRAIAETLAEKLVIRGQFACDFVVDDKGSPWLIECNPRAVSGVHLFSAGGGLANAILGRGVAVVDQTASAHIAAALWRYGWLTAMREKRMQDWKRQRATGRDVLSAPNDKGPVTGALIDSLGYSLRALQTGVSLEEAMTADMEWNGEPL